MSEKWTDKETWSTDLSPTTIFLWPALPVQQLYGGRRHVGGAGVYPGWWGSGVGLEGCYTGYSQDHPRTHI